MRGEAAQVPSGKSECNSESGSHAPIVALSIKPLGCAVACGENCLDKDRLVAKHLSTVSEGSPDSSPVSDYFNNSGKRVGYFHGLWRDFSCSASASGSWPSGINPAVSDYSVNLQTVNSAASGK